MIRKTEILKNLKRLEKLYTASNFSLDSEFYSKLAILELCGWIEISMDEIISKSCSRKIKCTKNVNHINGEVIKRNYSFDYEAHFRRMLIQVIGLIGIEQLEKHVDNTKFALLCSTLTTLKIYRDQEAHTHISNKTTRRINAPSLTISQFSIIYNGLRDIEITLKNIGY